MKWFPSKEEKTRRMVKKLLLHLGYAPTVVGDEKTGKWHGYRLPLTRINEVTSVTLASAARRYASKLDERVSK